VAAVIGAAAGALALLLAVGISPTLDLEFDRPVPQFATGFYPPERHLSETFVWTSGRAAIGLDGIDRRVPWQCLIRLRSGRPEPADAPMVDIALDGRTIVTRPAPAAYQDIVIAVPAGDARRLSLVIAAPTFTPGPADDRALGVQLDRVRCAPFGAIRPPATVVASASLPPALFGVACGLGGLAFGSLIPLLLVVAGLQALVLSLPPALYSTFPVSAACLAAVIALATVLLQKAAERRAGKTWHEPARLALGVTSVALYVKLVALLQPAKATIDALFHAHRLEGVLAGRFFFTQPIQDAVQFPYAIALYVFTAPWTLFTDNHVALLRIVISTAEALAGGLLYLMVARHWQDRWAGASAVALFHLVPIAYAVVGNANMTNAFGQSVALVTIAAATVWSLDWKRVDQLVGLTLLAALAFLSHVTTFAQLGVTLGAIGILGAWRRARSFGVPGRAILLATAAAAVLAVVLYYGHFGDVYATARNAGAPIDTAAPAPSFVSRAIDAAWYGVQDLGWPIVVLAGVGLWRLAADRSRDRLTLTLAGWAAAYVVFAALGTLSPVNARYERYAAEFISRVDFATYPAVVVLAARGGLWIWRRGPAGRLVVLALWFGAAITGYQHWARWLS
jgi:hypothetical protein